MLEIYSYEYIRAANEERRTRALDRYERLYRRSGDPGSPATQDADIVEIAFADGCAEHDQISA
jgi:hypothetical protein